MRWEVRTMRSGTSLFNGTIFKKTVLRYWPVWAAYSIIWLLVLPLQGLMMLQLEAQARPGLTGGYMQTFAQQVVTYVAKRPIYVMKTHIKAQSLCRWSL